MEFDKSGSTIFRVRLNAKEQKAFDMEARRMLAEHTRKHEIEIEAIVIRRLRKITTEADDPWGEIRLKRFYDGIAADLKELTEHYEMPEEDAPWLCTRELLKEGFDIEAWHRARYPNEKYNIEFKTK